MKALSVINGLATWSVERADCLPWLRRLRNRCVRLVFFSPPYEDARLYDELGFKLVGQAWVDWLRPIIVECARVSSGLVCVNMAGKVKDHRYSAAVEWLVADLTRLDGLVCGPSPYAWVKSEDFDDARGNGTPGSGGARYHRRDWEPIYAFCLPDRLPLAWTDNTAFGRPPIYGPGGAFSNRAADGTRANDPWKTATRGPGQGPRRKDGSRAIGPSRRANGAMKSVKRSNRAEARAAGVKMGYVSSGSKNGDTVTEQTYLPPKISNHGNVLANAIMMASDVLRVPVGGGKLGCPIAHAGEAPMSLQVAERFVCWFCPPSGIVLDPFVGTGTTTHAALKHGRRFVGCDLRESQVLLTEQRVLALNPQE